MGDPCGIGPEIIAKALTDHSLRQECRPVVLGDLRAMDRALKVTGAPLRIKLCQHQGWPGEDHHGIVNLVPLSALKDEEMAYGAPCEASGAAVYAYIAAAAECCLAGEASAMATAPINKEALNRAGHNFPGHTELLKTLTGADQVVMMLAGTRLRVTLVTIHEPLRAVPELLTVERILATIFITHRDLTRYFQPAPRIAVLALNPHCGEGGLFGDEEKRLIVPAVARAKEMGIDVHGPLSADTLFHFAVQGDYDAVVCMYHDQGLIPLKLLHFDDGVNITLGLPIIRTSVDHGTAYGLAGTGKASAASMTMAIRQAAVMARAGRQNQA
jgi:4-hydroxythreonine-4-phosphate dehydrogenase